MILSEEQIVEYKKDFKSILLDKTSYQQWSLAEAGLDFIDTIESLQQEIAQHITWNEAHTKARVEQAQQIERLQRGNERLKADHEIQTEIISKLNSMSVVKDAALEQARKVIRGVFREQPSQESIEFAEYVLRDIDKALGGATDD